MDELQKILIVDDSPKNLQLFGTILKGKDYQVMIAQTTQFDIEALRKSLKYFSELIEMVRALLGVVQRGGPPHSGIPLGGTPSGGDPFDER